jgi:hypothetical protein
MLHISFDFGPQELDDAGSALFVQAKMTHSRLGAGELETMQSKVRRGEAAYVLVGVGVSSLVVVAIAYLVYSFWK